jgi:hypothetical protein
MQEFPQSQPGEMPAYCLPQQVVLTQHESMEALCVQVQSDSDTYKDSPRAAETPPLTDGTTTPPLQYADSPRMCETPNVDAVQDGPGDHDHLAIDDCVVILSSAIDEEVENYPDIEVAFGTVADDHDNEDDWATPMSTRQPHSLVEMEDAPEVMQGGVASETSPKLEKVVSKTKWADLPDDDDGLPSGPLCPWPWNSPVVDDKVPKASDETEAPRESVPSPSKTRKCSQKARMSNRKLQWKAKT